MSKRARKKARRKRELKKMEIFEKKSKKIGKAYSVILVLGVVCIAIGLNLDVDFLLALGVVAMLPFFLTVAVGTLADTWTHYNARLPEFKGRGLVVALMIIIFLAFSYAVVTDPNKTGLGCGASVYKYRAC